MNALDNENPDHPKTTGSCPFECVIILMVGFYAASFFANTIL